MEKKKGPFKRMTETIRKNINKMSAEKQSSEDSGNVISGETQNELNEQVENSDSNDLGAEQTGEQVIIGLEQELDAAKDKYLRIFAEFENYKKRTYREKMEFAKYAGEDLILSLLPVVDDFDRALKSITSASDLDALKTGVTLIHTKLKSVLEARGLKEINAVGEKFNTDLHEAITTIPATSEEAKGVVIDQVESGYSLNDKIIRYAKVVVAN